MKTFIAYLAKRLVDNADQVQVNEEIGNSASVYELRAGDGDLGKVIGKQGRTLQALRTILIASGTRDNRRVMLEVLE